MPDRSIDMPALAAQTFHDAELRAEILRMFIEQAPALVQAALAASGEARAEIAHRLRGSALAIAAGPLAVAAGQLETAPGETTALRAFEQIAAQTIEAARLILERSAS
jgi:HPt (histidine-containing phosphotransfer) domain-containing protein